MFYLTYIRLSVLGVNSLPRFFFLTSVKIKMRNNSYSLSWGVGVILRLVLFGVFQYESETAVSGRYPSEIFTGSEV